MIRDRIIHTGNIALAGDLFRFAEPGAWIRAPTRRCVSERWRSQFQFSRRETANSQFSILNSQFSSRTAARGLAALRRREG